MVSNTNTHTYTHTHIYIYTNYFQTSIKLSVVLRVIVITKYSTLPKSPELGSHRQVHFCVTASEPLLGAEQSYRSAGDTVSTF